MRPSLYIPDYDPSQLTFRQRFWNLYGYMQLLLNMVTDNFWYYSDRQKHKHIYLLTTLFFNLFRFMRHKLKRFSSKLCNFSLYAIYTKKDKFSPYSIINNCID